MCSKKNSVVKVKKDGQTVSLRGEFPSDLSTERVILRHDHYEKPSPWGAVVRILFQGTAVACMITYIINKAYQSRTGHGMFEDPEEARRVLLTNRWGTETVQLRQKEVLVPENEDDAILLVQAAKKKNHNMRCVGASLSPNLIVSPKRYIVNMKNLCNIVKIDKKNRLVTVQAGASLGKLLDALKEEGLTLRTVPSHRAATVGGIISTGSHGSCPKVGPIDNDVVSMKIITPSQGLTQVPSEDLPHLFTFAKVSLGMYGIITEVVLQCTERYKLEEHIQLTTMAQVQKNHAKWLSENESLVYLWFPDENDNLQAVVIRRRRLDPRAPEKCSVPEREALKPLRELMGMDHDTDEANPTLEQLRSALYEYGPKHLKEWVPAVNNSELDYWRSKEGLHRVGWSDEIMRVADYGPHHVVDFCVPVTRQGDQEVGSDLRFVAAMYRLIREKKIGMHPPIVQTFSASSSSAMSPAVDEDPQRVFSWVEFRTHVSTDTDSMVMKHYKMDALREEAFNILVEFGAVENLSTCTSKMFSRYDTIKSFRQVRHEVDSGRIFSSTLLEGLFGDLDRKRAEIAKREGHSGSGQILV
eukprot:Plantae.Rhodophyta-Purpureofilum_apyrenoidigerum.ctg2084.p1 GENE.Plantae.Rhodophyta-Purpureofilum_apyrenoidigerum.ctg2084~~Plantae.Rhodophyta-Purpureofilum_apyrenoidigerum.ctg2084.p1  ORF type:complete len:633 (-),score=97.27 Plantae.Rhodophyta-Purpureofilum_apyrenoidigerum.ctg2084:1199-2950(-)